MTAVGFDEFVAHLRHEIHLHVPDPPGPALGLFDDLELDSLGAFELLLTVEDLAGVDVPPMDPPEMYSLGDVYRYYVQLTKAPPHGT